MVLYHQTFSPSTCSCIIEEQFEHDPETGLNGNASLWFFHYVCPKHEPLVKNKPKLSNEEFDKKIIDTVKHHEFLLSENRKRHMKDFDEHPVRKQKTESIKWMKMLKSTEKHALKMEAALDSERIRTVNFLDNHDNDSMHYLLSGLYSPYAFIAQEVYDQIKKEPIIENDG
jgi:hypothetical protein